MENLPDLQPGRFLLMVMPRTLTDESIKKILILIPSGPVRMVIGNNRFDAYTIARALHRHTWAPRAYLEEIRLARAFTCYQMLTLLQETAANPTPTLVVGLLSTFYDENISDFESSRLLEACMN